MLVEDDVSSVVYLVAGIERDGERERLASGKKLVSIRVYES
jgi:hypothetical protein